MALLHHWPIAMIVCVPHPCSAVSVLIPIYEHLCEISPRSHQFRGTSSSAPSLLHCRVTEVYILHVRRVFSGKSAHFPERIHYSLRVHISELSYALSPVVNSYMLFSRCQTSQPKSSRLASWRRSLLYL